MKLNLSIIKTYLPESYHPQMYGPHPEILNAPRPRFATPGTTIQEGLCYFLPAGILADLKPVTNCSILCIGGPIPYRWQQCGCHILQIMHEVDYNEIFNQITRIYDFFDEWDSKLRDELEKQTDFDISRIMRMGVEVLSNPIQVSDQSLRIILSSHLNASDHRQILIQKESHLMGPEMTDSVMEVCNLERHIRIPYISSIVHNNQRSYCMNLYPQGYFTGCVSLTESNHPFRDCDFAIADHYFRLFQLAFEKHLHGFSHTEDASRNLLWKLLHNQPLMPEEQKQMELEPQEAWYFFKLKKQGSSSMPQEYMHTALKTFIPEVEFSAVYHQEIAGLIRVSQPEHEQSLIRNFSEMLSRMNYSAGVSNKFSHIRHLNVGIIQADYALKHGHQVLNIFTDHLLAFMISECSGRIGADHLTNQALQNVIVYDAAHQTDYLLTLKTYLLHEMSVTHTANALYIHRSSLLKRLDKLERLMQEDLSDPNHRLYYRIWFALQPEI